MKMGIVPQKKKGMLNPLQEACRTMAKIHHHMDEIPPESLWVLGSGTETEGM